MTEDYYFYTFPVEDSPEKSAIQGVIVAGTDFEDAKNQLSLYQDRYKTDWKPRKTEGKRSTVTELQLSDLNQDTEKSKFDYSFIVLNATVPE